MILFSLCIDHPQPSPLEVALQYQTQCIINLLGASTEGPVEFLRETNFIGPDDTLDNICNWIGFRCSHGIIETLSFDDLSCWLEWNPDWFPPDIRTISFSGVAMANSVLHIRALPLSLYECFLRHCGLIGEVFLDDLPPNLQVFNVYGNMLSGTANLLQLPKRIREIDLRQNCIKAAIIPESLPPQLYVRVKQQRKKKPHMHYLGEKPEKQSQSIFTTQVN